MQLPTTFAAPQLQIYVGTTFFKFRASKRGLIGPGFSVVDYMRSTLMEREWVPRFKQYVTTYTYSLYEDSTGMAVLPRYALDSFLLYISHLKYEIIDIDPVKPKKTKFRLRPKISPRADQEELIGFMCTDSSFSPVSASCGSGKTFCSIYSIFKNGTPAVVVVSGLGEQWYKEFHHFLKLNSDDVYVIQGFDTLKLLWEGIRKGYRPKVLIFSTRTLVLYACNPTPPYSEIPSYPELQQRLGIGIKIIDECHLNFHANVMIDLMSNVKKNIYLSATYSRSSIMGNKIFNMVYPRDMVYGEAVAHKYTVVHMIRYHLDIPSDEHEKFKVAKGYLHALYEKYLLRRKSYYRVFLDQVLIPCIRMYYLHCRKEKQKALILCQTKDFTIALQDEIQKEIKFLKVAAFLSKDPKYGKTENFDADIIVSTIKSSGTGRDIKGLKTCINTVSFASAPQAAQVMGRPREIKGEDTIYIDLWNGEISTHYHHQRRRMEAYRPRAKTIDETTIN